MSIDSVDGCMLPYFATIGEVTIFSSSCTKPSSTHNDGDRAFMEKMCAARKEKRDR